MKLTIQSSQKDAFMKSCIELRLTCKFHEMEQKELQPEMVTAYVRDDQLGELIPKIAFYLGVQFGFELHKELGVNI